MKHCGKLAVELNRRDRRAGLHELLGQRTFARADLDNLFIGLEIEGVDYSLRNGRIPQEVLAERSLGSVLHLETGVASQLEVFAELTNGDVRQL